jgi:cysteine desulfurase / selenocysteine lyase
MNPFPADVLARARELFPFLATGKIYFNHAATSPLSTRVLDALSRHLKDRSTGGIDTYWTDVRVVKAWREAVQTLINAESPDRISFQGNTSDALNIIAAGLPWKSGDRVLLNDAEFPANIYPYLNLKRFGVEIDLLPADRGVFTAETVAGALTPRTRLVALSAVQFLSGYRADLREIGELCRRHGVVFAVDGIQAVGGVRIDVQAMRIDALAAGAQKWQMSPQGTGFLYLTEELQERIHQAHLGWLSVHDPWEFRDLNQPLASSARRYEGGSLNMAGIHATFAAISTILEFGPGAIEEHLLAITGRMLEVFEAIDGIEIITPREESRRAGIVTISAGNREASGQLFDHLRQQSMIAAVREGLVRFSPHFYNSMEEVDRIAEAVRLFISRRAGTRTIAGSASA